jgi:hypothetical protein
MGVRVVGDPYIVRTMSPCGTSISAQWEYDRFDAHGLSVAGLADDELVEEPRVNRLARVA